MARVWSALNVPRPERGYWAKLAFGKAPVVPARQGFVVRQSTISILEAKHYSVLIATAAMEQPVWDPNAGTFFVSIPALADSRIQRASIQMIAKRTCCCRLCIADLDVDQRLQSTYSVEKLVSRHRASVRSKFDLIERPLLNATRAGDGL